MAHLSRRERSSRRGGDRVRGYGLVRQTIILVRVGRISGASRLLALGPGSPSTPLRCAAGVRERAVEGFAPIPPLLSRAHAAKAECDPGPSARLRREAAPNSFRRG